MVWRSLGWMALLCTLAPPVALAQAGPGTDGARLYQERCAACHGDNGDGKSHAARDLSPRPRDFTAPQAAVELTRPRVLRSIREGRPGTAMVGWQGRLTDRQMAALADFIRDRFMVPTAYDTSNEGRRIYAEYCSVCHGDKGNGVSRASGSLDPRPRDFASAAARRELTRERMVFSVTYGRADTAMAAWGSQLSATQVGAVVDYIRATFMQPAPGGPPAAQPAVAGARHGDTGHDPDSGHAHATPGGDPAAYFAQPFPHGLKGRRREGKALYAFNCVPCHGEKGDGRGPRAFFILPKPRDFSHAAARASLNRPHLHDGISKGTLGTEMPAWDKVLSPQQIADIAEYVLAAFIRPPRAADSRTAAGSAREGHSDGGKRPSHAHPTDAPRARRVE